MTNKSSNPPKNAMRFFKLETLGSGDRDLCFIDDFVEGIKMESWRVVEGERLGSLYPKDAKIYLNKKHPGIELASFLGNTESMIVGSTELKEAIEKHCKNEIEYLPFTLYDHRKRIHSRDYFIINPIGTFDCLDFKASDISWDDEDPEEILDIEEHVLDRKKMKDVPQLFRVDRDPDTYVIGLELGREIQKRNLTNIIVEELEFSDSK